MGNKKNLLRHAAIGTSVASLLLAAFWIGAPSGHSERPSPATRPAADTNLVKAILDYQAIVPNINIASSFEPSPYTTTELMVSPGDTLMEMLVKADVPRNQAHNAIKAMSKVFRPRDLKPGTGVTVTQMKSDSGFSLKNVNLAVDPRQNVQISHLEPKGFRAEIVKRPLTTRAVRSGGIIRSSLYLAGRRADVPPTVLAELIRIFSFDVDFQRDVQPDDSFDLLYERHFDDGGNAVAEGKVQIAEMVLSGKRIRLYRHRTADGDIDYFDAKGRSVRKALILTPIDGARISSGYGRRRHPVLGYTKMHRGIDFAAPRGTPIYAAGHGTIEVAGRNGGYGKYVRIRHNGNYKTAYAHLKGYARGVRRGSRVRQGQVIGYVGSTGRSTGPHLHYEILRNGRQMNPKRLNLPSGRKLKGAALKRFLVVRDSLEQRYATLPLIRKTAENCGVC